MLELCSAKNYLYSVSETDGFLPVFQCMELYFKAIKRDNTACILIMFYSEGKNGKGSDSKEFWSTAPRLMKGTSFRNQKSKIKKER